MDDEADLEIQNAHLLDRLRKAHDRIEELTTETLDDQAELTRLTEAMVKRGPSLGDLIFYMLESKVHSAPITSILVVENAHDDWGHTDEQKKTWQPFGPSVTRYATVHGTLDASQCFPTRDALLASL